MIRKNTALVITIQHDSNNVAFQQSREFTPHRRRFSAQAGVSYERVSFLQNGIPGSLIEAESILQ